MKIELVKETKLDGVVLYFTELDGSYVSDSLSHNYDKAYDFYQTLVKNNGNKVIKEVIESTEL
jgi:hypothetical protein